MKYWFLWVLIPLPLAGAVALYFYPKVLTGDYAEITIDSIASPGPGEVELRFHGRLSQMTYFSGGAWERGEEGPGFAGRPRRLEDHVMKVYTIRNDRGDLASSAEALGRLRVQAGRSYRIRPNRPLTIFKYDTFDGDVAELTFTVLPH